MPDISAKIIGAIGIVVITVTLLALTPTIVDQVQSMNTSNWTFTGAEGAKMLLGLVPFIWVASILVCASVGMFALAKSGFGKSRLLLRNFPVPSMPEPPSASKVTNRKAMLLARA